MKLSAYHAVNNKKLMVIKFEINGIAVIKYAVIIIILMGFCVWGCVMK